MEQIGPRGRVNDQALQIWVVDDDKSICWVLERALRSGGMLPRTFAAAETVLDALSQESPDVLVTDIQMPGQSGLELLRKTRDIRPGLPVIVMTAYSNLGNAVSSYTSGAFEYLPKPFDLDHAMELIRRAATSGTPGDADGASLPDIPDLIGHAPAMQQVFRAIGRMARSSITTLITGELGTGKEFVARALHDHSPRAGKPFIPLNTSAIPGELLESELFGHEKGAFFGADAQHLGRIEEANGGTLFLDEIGEMPTPLQTRLFRLLVEGKFNRAGGHSPIYVDVRLIAATHQDLRDRAARGQFRGDLLNRINVIRIELPSLRARSEDIPELLDHYFKVAAHELGIQAKTVAKDAREGLMAYAWPGNERELANLCMSLSVLVPGNEVRLVDLPRELGGVVVETEGSDWVPALTTWANRHAMQGHVPLLNEALPKFEKALIGAALKRTSGHRRAAAELLGWGRNTLTHKLKELGISETE